MQECICYNCQHTFELLPGIVGRSETCPKCSADVKVCLNCFFYDTSAYNECREPSAERVTQKDKSNFCDYFKLGNGTQNKNENVKDSVLKDLDNLFKK